MERLFTESSYNRVVLPTNVSVEDRNRERLVVYYGRVSSEHEAQLSALANQMQWYDDQTKYHPNWRVIHKYIDEGITGTQAKKRPAFMQMLADAREHKFDLIVTREVCRFARNTVDTLVVTRELKNIGIEVYFVNDNIWTMDGDGELRLSLMATLAQEESRKTSERVRAGQKISRDKGVLYGNGNILGYDRVGSTYVINQEQAETVRMIYDLYLKGYGFTKIAHELTKLKRRDASGTIKWDCTKVSRTLHNATYMGYKCYLKSHRDNYLDQKTITNRDESTYMYVKGDFEPIISEDIWYRCKEIRENRRIERGIKAGKRVVIGVRPCNDIWIKKTVCKCGCHFRKDKWHRNKNGVTYGYKCYNVLNNGSRSSRINDGIEELDGFCDMGTIAGWKFDLMAYEIFRKLTFDFDSLLDDVYSNYVKNDTSEAKDTKAEIKRLTGVIQKEKMKLDNLTTMRMEGEITKEEYLDYKVKVTANIEATQKRIDKLQQEDLTTQGNSEHQFSKEELGGMLRIELDFTQPIVKRGIIDAFVRKIVAHSALEFDWYLNLVPHAADSGFKEVTSFTIEYERAHSYREMRGEILRKYQYKNIVMHIYA